MTTSIRTPPPTPTEEDEDLFDNLDLLLHDLLFIIYHEYLAHRLHHRR